MEKGSQMALIRHISSLWGCSHWSKGNTAIVISSSGSSVHFKQEACMGFFQPRRTKELGEGILSKLSIKSLDREKTWKTPGLKKMC